MNTRASLSGMTNSPRPSRSRDNQAEIQSTHERDHGSARDNTSHRVLDHHTLTLYTAFDFVLCSVDGNTSGQCSAQERAPCFELLCGQVSVQGGRVPPPLVHYRPGVNF